MYVALSGTLKQQIYDRKIRSTNKYCFQVKKYFTKFKNKL